METDINKLQLHQVQNGGKLTQENPNPNESVTRWSESHENSQEQGVSFINVAYAQLPV